MSDEKRVSPFSNGDEYRAWQRRNCARCLKGWRSSDTQPPSCPIELAVSYAAIDDGSVSEEMAKRMGYSDPLAYAWDCPEREDEPPPIGSDAYRAWVERQGQMEIPS